MSLLRFDFVEIQQTLDWNGHYTSRNDDEIKSLNVFLAPLLTDERIHTARVSSTCSRSKQQFMVKMHMDCQEEKQHFYF